MPILVIAFVTLLAVLAFGPMLWIKNVLKRHGVERPDLPGTGAELARHLLDEAGLTDVKVEVAEQGDHYDPAARTVRLLRQHHDGRSIAAVAVAAHEVSHAVQHARSEPAFMARISLIKNLAWLDPIALGIVILAPIVFAFVHVPALMLLQFLVGILLMSIRVVAHFVTLPVELDASFGKALPVLDRGGYLRASDMPAAREVLRAAAWTYVASTLFTLLQIWRWFRP